MEMLRSGVNWIVLEFWGFIRWVGLVGAIGYWRCFGSFGGGNQRVCWGGAKRVWVED